MAKTSSPIQIYALGGLGEVGKNIYCFESKRSIIMIDCGVRFPGERYPGVDYVIPDFTHLKNNRSKIRALFITHGHEDHIGGIPFLLRNLNVPVIYAPPLAKALIEKKLDESRFNYNTSKQIKEYGPDDVIRIDDDFTVSFFRVTHSIPDAYGICVDTPQGRIIETGDFKIDLTPVGPDFELQKLAQLGTEGIDLLMADSTNAEIEGYSPSEKNVRQGVEEVFEKANGRIIVSTFSSNINRIQQVTEVAVEHGRKICILGRSMVGVVSIARAKGYIKIPDASIINDDEVNRYKPSEICILCTGSQGEEMAALSRIANRTHRNIRIIPGDTVVFSSNPIPGNGALVSQLVNNLYKQGADVKQDSLAFSLHSTGHPAKQELRLMQKITSPKYFMPVHGEYRMLKLHGEVAVECGVSPNNVFICENGDSLKLFNHEVKRSTPVHASDVLIDGKDIDGLKESLLVERETLKNDGLVAVVLGVNSRTNKLVIKPQIHSYGFLDTVTDHYMRHAQDAVEKEINKAMSKRVTFSELKALIVKTVSNYLRVKTDRNPMIVPVIMNENNTNN